MRQALEMIAKGAGRMMREARAQGFSVVEKAGIGNFVTDADENVQRYLERELFALLPEAAFVGEENGMQAAGATGLRWIVDPIDGTTNFIRNMNYSAVSIALADGAEPVAGVVYNPFVDELFAAERGKGAFLNGSPIRVASRPMPGALISVGFTSYTRELADDMFRVFRSLFDRGEDMRSHGSSALDVSSIAAGRLDVFLELSLHPWDIAAASCILCEAGGVVSTATGETLPLDRSTSILAASAACYEEALSACRAALLPA